MSYTCKYCKRNFSKESTLAAHACEQKLRFQQEKEVGVQLGFKAYLRFYEITQGSAKFKTYMDFAGSTFYKAFVKFGRHLVDIKAVNSSAFIDWLLKNNKKLDHWCHEKHYAEWLLQYLRREAVQDAIERSLQEMQEYADANSELNGQFIQYFKKGNSNRIVQHIMNGRISAWVVYNCASGIEWLDNLNQEQIGLILPYIDPDFWQQKFKDYVADAEWCKDILKKACL